MNSMDKPIPITKNRGEKAMDYALEHVEDACSELRVVLGGVHESCTDSYGAESVIKIAQLLKATTDVMKMINNFNATHEIIEDFGRLCLQKRWRKVKEDI